MFLKRWLGGGRGGLGSFAAEPSRIQDDESVVFFPKVGGPTGEAKDAPWRLEIHGWIFEPEEDSIRRRALLSALGEALGLEKGDEEAALFRERARWFLVDNERGKSVGVELSRRAHVLPPSSPDGHFMGTLSVSADEARASMRAQPGGIRRFAYRAVTAKDDHRLFSGEAIVVEGRGISVISDIDDTIKISETPDRKALLKNTFLREYRAVEGMAEAYRSLEGATFHYLSASPWQLYHPLSEFLKERRFPPGSYHLKSFRPKDSTFWNLLAAPREHKIPVIESLLRRFPQREWILVGDSTEEDAEIYGEVGRRYPERIARICIREVEGSSLPPSRRKEAFADVPDGVWNVYRTAAELRDGLDRWKRERGG